MTFSDALLLIALAAAQPVPQPMTISGPAIVIDGDTLDINDANQGRVRIRLFGIDAPESEQRCLDGAGRPYNCGSLAADALQEEIGNSTVVCFAVDTDRYKRIVAVCTARERDLGRSMVQRGHALDYPFFSGGRYHMDEMNAASMHRGIHAGHFQNPRDWRMEHRR